MNTMKTFRIIFTAMHALLALCITLYIFLFAGFTTEKGGAGYAMIIIWILLLISIAIGAILSNMSQKRNNVEVAGSSGKEKFLKIITPRVSFINIGGIRMNSRGGVTAPAKINPDAFAVMLGQMDIVTAAILLVISAAVGVMAYLGVLAANGYVIGSGAGLYALIIAAVNARHSKAVYSTPEDLKE
jgi:hypothetical protein